MWEVQYGCGYEEKVASSNDEIDNLRGETVANGEARSDFNDDVLKQSGESEKILGLGEDENIQRQGGVNTDESLVSGNENRQRDGSAGLTDCAVRLRDSARRR